MSIDIYYCRESDGQFELDSEAIPFASVGEFYNLAHMLGPMFDLLFSVEVLPPELTKAVAAFREYVDESRARNEESFAGYVGYMGDLARQFAHTSDNPEAIKYVDTDPTAFHPDVRAFLGRLVLGEEVSTPHEIEHFSGVLAAAVGLMNANLKQHGASDPGLAKALESARDKAMLVLHHCDHAVAEDKCVIFHA